MVYRATPSPVTLVTRPQAIVHWGSRAAWYRESGEMDKHETVPG